MKMTDSYISVDIETTGLDPKLDKIIEIGAVKIVDGRETGSFSTLVNPGRQITERVTELTGITDEMVAAAPKIGEAIKKAAEFFEEMPLLGHHVIFDYSFLKRAAVNEGLVFEKNGIDTLYLCRCFMPGEEKKNLTAACKWFGVKQDTHHRALADAYAAHFLYQAVKASHQSLRPEVFSGKPLIYQVKKDQPASKRQKEHLHDLIKYHKICLSVQTDELTRSEASRLVDQIISQYGRLSK